MFEAHYSHAEDFQGLEAVATSWTKTYYRRHKFNFQPLTIWFALGKRKASSGSDIQRKVFVYIEYQDEQENNRYRSLEVDAGLSVVEVLSLATEADLG